VALKRAIQFFGQNFYYNTYAVVFVYLCNQSGGAKAMRDALRLFIYITLIFTVYTWGECVKHPGTVAVDPIDAVAALNNLTIPALWGWSPPLQTVPSVIGNACIYAAPTWLAIVCGAVATGVGIYMGLMRGQEEWWPRQPMLVGCLLALWLVMLLVQLFGSEEVSRISHDLTPI